ncbi:MAG TPA: MlaD family protein [Solirubrobacteraceae bacterium]|nr:MlaD family protein [Solirubrobacteraceae bacterium]
MGPQRRASIAANPFLIGAITTLVIVVAVYLSYNANNGLPFVPAYNLKAAIPNADGLIVGNDVRIGGTRVGQVVNIVPYQEPRTGRSIAIVEMRLNKGVEPLPANTTDSVLSRSSVGLKYFALFKGNSSATFKGGQTIPLSHYREPVQLYDLFNMFDKPTRVASQENLIDGGDGFAGRGEGLNRTLRTFRPLVRNLEPVMRNLASPRTGFGELWRDLDKPAEQTAAVARQNATFYSDLDTFFSAWASVAHSLEEAIEGGPPSLQEATRSFREQAAFTENSAEFMRLLRPSARALRSAAPTFADAVEEATRTFPQAAGLNSRLKTFLEHLRSFANDPVVELALETLTHTAELGNSVVAGIAPEQSTCNYVTLTFRNLASLLSEDIGIGTVARVVSVLAPTGPNSEGVPSSAPAAGPSPEAAFGSNYNSNFLHVNPYPNVAGPGQPALCEAGNEIYSTGNPNATGTPFIGHAARSEDLRERTRRSQSLFEETYPPATLRALGIRASKKGKKG